MNFLKYEQSFYSLCCEELFECESLKSIWESFSDVFLPFENFPYWLHIVKLLAKSKLKSLPYNHTDHPPPPHLPITLNQVYTSLYKSYINIWGIIRIVHSRAIYLSIVTHPNQTKSTFDWQFSDLNYIKIKLNLTAE